MRADTDPNRWFVLLVDDDEDEYIITRNLLASRAQQYSLDWAKNFDDGLAAVQTGKYDAVLVDYYLGKHTGAELIRRARAAGCKVPLLVITGAVDQAVDLEVMQAGASDYLNRAELTAALLERALRYAIRNHQISTAAQAQIESERASLRTLIENAPAGILMTDAQGNFTVTNPASESFFPPGGITGTASGPVHGYVLTRKDGTVYAPEELPLPRSLRGETVTGEELIIRHEDGRNVFTLVNASPIFTPDHKIIGSVSVLLNNTQQKEIEAALRESEERFRLASQSMQGFVWDYDLTAGRVYRSDGVELVTGYTAAELVSNRNAWIELMHPDDQPPAGLTTADLLSQSSDTYTREYRILHKSQQWVWVQEQGKLIRDNQGRLVRVVGTTIDIHARKQAELALRESEDRFRSVIANTRTVMFTVDKNLCFTWAYNLQQGYQLEEIIGKREEDFMEPEAAAVLVKPKLEVLRTGKPVQREMVYRMNGRMVAYQAAYDPIFSKDGEVTGVSCVAMDVTDLVQLRSQQAQDQAKIEIQHSLIQQREQERMQIARDLHDGPVQELTSLLFLLQNLQTVQSEPERLQIIEEMKQSLNRAAGDLRSYATELRPPVLASFGLEKAIQSHLVEFKRKYPHITIHFKASQVGEILPEAPRTALYRIYQELLNNIVKHSGASEVSIHFEKTLEQALLEVHDNGKGFQVPKEWLVLARNKHLGLVGIRERAEAVGGTVEVTSAPQKGTGVRVCIPLDDSDIITTK